MATKKIVSSFSFPRGKTFYRGVDVGLTRKENQIFRAIVGGEGWARSLDQIADEVWGDADINPDILIKVHIMAIRKKLKGVGANPNLIGTMRGLGYKIDLELL